uniref:Secreted protein n=1 Tax=Angiostrongylus cantonensis TaxID=6313 RepID=A0A0K0DQR7_ANGCA
LFRHAVPPSSALPRVAANRNRPQSMLSQNSQASSGLENIVWRNSSFSTSTIDSPRRLTISDDDTAQRVVCF